MTKFIFVLLASFLSKASGACRDGWVQFGANCYLLSQDRTSWSEAASFCNALHSHLAMVTSDDELNFLKSAIHQHSHARYQYWIDGTDEEVEGVWRWATTDQKITYYNWGHAQPDNRQVGNCLFLWSASSYKIADGVCEAHYNFICQSTASNNGAGIIIG